ncbi:MAG: hypothetical protein JSV65_06065 [Armatimonadota bacterium]|nr:MAG: hypothetical protein JSV65_06065 [Armatimonadota bacterium]
MPRRHLVSLCPAIAVCLTVALVPLVLTTALAWPGGGHTWGAEAATELFGLGPSHPNADPLEISRDRPVPLYPELELSSAWYDTKVGCCDEEDAETRPNWDWIREAACEMDDFESDTRHHFWYPEEGMHECPNDVAGINNAWESIHPFWIGAINAWQAGNLGNAYAYLGYAIHFVQDMGQPAHANEDMHPGDALSDDDSLEDWFTGAYARSTFQWNWPYVDLWPGPILYPPTSNAAILNTVLSANGGYWDPGQSEPIAPDSGWADMDAYFFDLSWPYTAYNKQQLFYIMYVVNQTGNWFASDSEPGNTFDAIGWLEYSVFPPHLLDEGTPVAAQDSDALDDNDSCDCDMDGDLSLIAVWAYATSFRASPAVIDLFRRTVDNAPPVTAFEQARVDGQPVVEWNNSPVTVTLTGATDYGNPGFRVSGVWKVWGTCEGETPQFTPDPAQTPYLAISQEGENHVQLLSTDWCGNVETSANDFTVKIDMTPPEITFPDLRPNYLTSEDFTATWVATDALSGVDYEYALLDGQWVTKGEVIDLALLAGTHTLEVYANDVAGNIGYAIYEFEVFIDAESWGLSVLVGNKTKGKAMFGVVEFPAPYDVGIIDVTTCTLVVGGTLDLTVSDPVVGGLAVLPAELITGVGDHDEDGIPDRMLRFDKEQFVAALGGLAGDIPAVVRGGLLPDGTPRFLGVTTVPVFAPPRY